MGVRDLIAVPLDSQFESDDFFVDKLITCRSWKVSSKYFRYSDRLSLADDKSPPIEKLDGLKFVTYYQDGIVEMTSRDYFRATSWSTILQLFCTIQRVSLARKYDLDSSQRRPDYQDKLKTHYKFAAIYCLTEMGALKEINVKLIY